MNYQEALKYIYGFSDLERGIGFSSRSPSKYRFDRVSNLLEVLGNPHHNLRFVHVAGSNGKGSTAAMVGSIAQSAGVRIGLYTQPHLHTFRERIMVDGVPISQTEFSLLITRIKAAVSTCALHNPKLGDPTTFEIATVAAFKHFVEANVELAIVEVGLGGTWDATNVIDPIVSVITSLSLEHQSILGNTLREIASEKAGIIKPGRPVVTVQQHPEAMEIIREQAQSLNSNVHVVGTPLGLHLEYQEQTSWATNPLAMPCCLRLPGGSSHVQLPLIGKHQLLNAAAAVGAALELAHAGTNIDGTDMVCGLEKTVWPARVEIIQEDPLLIVDGAHTPDACQQLVETLSLLSANNLHLIFGSGSDKNASAMLKIMSPLVSNTYLCASKHPRATRTEDNLTIATNLGLEAQQFNSVSDALKAAELAVRRDETILVTGSIFVAAEARQAKGLADEIDPDCILEMDPQP